MLSRAVGLMPTFMRLKQDSMLFFKKASILIMGSMKKHLSSCSGAAKDMGVRESMPDLTETETDQTAWYMVALYSVASRLPKAGQFIVKQTASAQQLLAS